ncbi:MAG: hypothetical protein WBN81_15270 [Gammaproteobacteria bacterium]
MTRILITCVSILLLAACSLPRMKNPLPPIKSPDTSSQISLNNVFPAGRDVYQLTFTLDNVPIYRFGETRQYAFYLDTGNYMLGFTNGSKNCETNVYIKPNANYVFEFGPECRIEMISE